MFKLRTTGSTTTVPAYNSIGPHGASVWGGGVASVLLLLVILAAVAVMIWLFFSYRQHLRGHEQVRWQYEPDL
jgi:hypothetical protein